MRKLVFKNCGCTRSKDLRTTDAMLEVPFLTLDSSTSAPKPAKQDKTQSIKDLGPESTPTLLVGFCIFTPHRLSLLTKLSQVRVLCIKGKEAVSRLSIQV